MISPKTVDRCCGAVLIVAAAFAVAKQISLIVEFGALWFCFFNLLLLAVQATVGAMLFTRGRGSLATACCFAGYTVLYMLLKIQLMVSTATIIASQRLSGDGLLQIKSSHYSALVGILAAGGMFAATIFWLQRRMRATAMLLIVAQGMILATTAFMWRQGKPYDLFLAVSVAFIVLGASILKRQQTETEI